MRLVLLVAIAKLRVFGVFIQPLIQIVIRIPQSIQSHRPLPTVRFDGHASRVEGVPFCVQLPDKLFPVGAVSQAVLNILLQLLPVSGLALLRHPISPLGLAAIEGGVGENG